MRKKHEFQKFFWKYMLKYKAAKQTSEPHVNVHQF